MPRRSSKPLATFEVGHGRLGIGCRASIALKLGTKPDGRRALASAWRRASKCSPRERIRAAFDLRRSPSCRRSASTCCPYQKIDLPADRHVPRRADGRARGRSVVRLADSDGVAHVAPERGGGRRRWERAGSRVTRASVPRDDQPCSTAWRCGAGRSSAHQSAAHGTTALAASTPAATEGPARRRTRSALRRPGRRSGPTPAARSCCRQPRRGARAAVPPRTRGAVPPRPRVLASLQTVTGEPRRTAPIDSHAAPQNDRPRRRWLK